MSLPDPHWRDRRGALAFWQVGRLRARRRLTAESDAKPPMSDRSCHLSGECADPNPIGSTDDLAASCYSVLRSIAATYSHHLNGGTLQPTLIVHEAYLKLVGPDRRAEGPAASRFTDREHFLAVAALAMRQVVQDHARKRRALKRGGAGDGARVGLGEAVALSVPGRETCVAGVVDLDDALTELAKADPRAARLVELRFFGGLTVEQAARVLEIAVTTAEKDWRCARAWLLVRLKHEPNGAREADERPASGSMAAAQGGVPRDLP